MMILACPRCHASLEDMDAVTKTCMKDRLTFYQVNGIWRMLLPERERYYTRFIRDYETIRRAEGRGSANALYYQTLPYHKTNDWKIRAKSFDVFLRHIIAPVENGGSALNILDLGAGNGWLSNRLALRGHFVAAVDLTINDFDGLGCYRYYDSKFLRIQSEFDHLPWMDHSVDLIVFNASLHYSVNYVETLGESLRVLNQQGQLVILDSPIYHEPSSGLGMVSEREAYFVKQYGFASNSLPSENYLTYARLNELANELNLSWEFATPFYNLKWSLNPSIARVFHRREPARFHLIIGRQK
ncbi:MAG: class I SAM-dependent methyltransferase [Anaerolineales bacterium]